MGQNFETTGFDDIDRLLLRLGEMNRDGRISEWCEDRIRNLADWFGNHRRLLADRDAEITRLKAERDAASAEVERLQAALARIRDIAADANHDPEPDPGDESPEDWNAWAFGMILREIDANAGGEGE
jgi:hypothetical protein